MLVFFKNLNVKRIIDVKIDFLHKVKDFKSWITLENAYNLDLKIVKLA